MPHIMKRLSQALVPYLSVIGILTLIPVSGLSAGGNLAVPVQVVRAVNVDLAPVTWMPGTVIGKLDSKVAAEVDGRIDTVADVGDYVDKQAILAQLDNTIFRMQVDEANAEIMPIKARLDFYKREVGRLEKLAEQNNAAKNRLDEVKSNRNQALGELEVKKSRLAQARDRYKKTVVYAPFAGVITERYKTEGEWVSVGDEIIRVVNIEDLEIQARIQQSTVVHIKQGGQLVVTDGVDQTVAIIKTIVRVGDDVSRLYEIRLAFTQPHWLSGHAVRIAIPADAARNVVAVPRDALVIRQNKTKVFRILENNTAEAVPVTTGIARDQLIEVTGDINAGDLVVIRGNERLRPEQQVTIQQGTSRP
jgi:RND family efflux transporter MFP subunit